METSSAAKPIEFQIMDSLESFAADPARHNRRLLLVAQECIVGGWTASEMKHLAFYRQIWRNLPVEAR